MVEACEKSTSYVSKNKKRIGQVKTFWHNNERKNGDLFCNVIIKVGQKERIGQVKVVSC